MHSMYGWLDPLRFLICLLFLMIASIYDIKTREVPNTVWIIFAPIGLALTLVQLALNNWDQTFIMKWIISATITIGLSLVLFYLGLFGGADAKALMCLAASMPTRPNLGNIKPILKPHMPIVSMPLPLSTFNNAVLVASLLPIAIVSRNVVDLARSRGKMFEGLEEEKLIAKVFAFITGFRVDVQKLRVKKHHYMLLEVFDVEENGKMHRHLKILQRLSGNGESEVKENIPSEVDGKIWVTIGLPFLFFITLGFLSAIFLGDLVLWLVNIAVF